LIQPGEIFRAFAVFVEPPSAEHAAVAETLSLGEVPSRSEHTDLFDFQLFPFASVYLGAEGMQGGEARDRIADFWRVLELEPPNDPDHLTVLLAAYGALVDHAEDKANADAENWRYVGQVFLHEFLLSWVPLFLARLRGKASSFYGAWADQLSSVLASEPLDERLAGTLAAALREADPLPDPREEGGEAFLQGLLAPVRSGFILTRDDLSAMADSLGLGRRVGERKYVLKSLLSQDAPRSLEALAGFAEEASQGHATSEMLEVTRDWWARRAMGSRDLLSELASESVPLDLATDPAGA